MQIIKFLCAGAVGTVLYYITLYVSTEIIGVWYLASAIFASVLNYSFNFVFQKFWTFGNRDIGTVQQQIKRYATMTAILFIINIMFLYALVEYLHIWYIAAQVIVTAILIPISFIVSRRIFAD